MPLIERDLLIKIKPFLQSKHIILITGPRRSGKSTFSNLLKNYLSTDLTINSNLIHSISFENRKLLFRFEERPLTFLSNYISYSIGDRTAYLLIDDFHFAENGLSKLLNIYNKLEKLKIFLFCTSSPHNIKQAEAPKKYKVKYFFLSPLNFSDFLSFNDERLKNLYNLQKVKITTLFRKGKEFSIKRGVDDLYEQFLDIYGDYALWGGYPEVLHSGFNFKTQKVLAYIYNEYLLNDMKIGLKNVSEKSMYLLSESLALNCGKEVMEKLLCERSKCTFNHLKRCMNVMIAISFHKEIEPFFTKKDKEISKQKKPYFCDPGIRNFLVDSFTDFSTRDDRDVLIGNVVFLCLCELCSDIGSIRYWRKKSGPAVDFIVSVGERLIPVVIKDEKFYTERVPPGLRSFIYSYNPDHAVVLTRNYHGYCTVNNTLILFFPFFYL